MSRAEDIKKMIPQEEAKKITISKSIVGKDFSSNKQVNIKPGAYELVGDGEGKGTSVISNAKGDLFIIMTKDI